MDFVNVRQRALKGGVTEVFADFLNRRCKDLMVRGGEFYAMWSDDESRWITDEFDVIAYIDTKLYEYSNNIQKTNPDQRITVRALGSTAGGGYKDWRSYISDLPDMFVPLNPRIMFAGDNPTREDFATKNVPYFLVPGNCDAYHELANTLYSPNERDKFEWAIGCILSGDVRKIQKFLVFYGGAGTGKSTIINIIERLFEGYCSAFKAADLTNRNNAFALEAFANNPMVAIQHDGDLSRIEDNTLMNSIVSHERIQVNQKYKTPYDMIFSSFLIMGTNSPVKITDSKSGITRRLIDVVPTGNKVALSRYNILMEQILENELGAIACYCIDRYRSMGRGYYADYKPISMMYKTDTFYNFISEQYDDFSTAIYVPIQRAYDLYKRYCEDALISYPLTKIKFKEELKSYFYDYKDRFYDKETDTQIRSVVIGFDASKFDEFKKPVIFEKEEDYINITMDVNTSLIDTMLSDCKAQYANPDGIPTQAWANVKTTLADIDTGELHYVMLPENHIVIDFDMKDHTGKKSKELNLKAASKWPATYTEYSKSGGVHMHYIYNGDVTKLAPIVDKDIEIKRFIGNASLRRKFTLCNGLEVAVLAKELPKKEGKKMTNMLNITSEMHIRALIGKALKRKVHEATKPNVDFICSVLTKAYEADVKYDVSDMRADIENFAMDSSNQREYCIKAVQNIPYKNVVENPVVNEKILHDDDLYFYDIEVKPNLLLVCIKKYGDTLDNTTVLVNPAPEALGAVIQMPLVGYNNKQYDNHIIYARYMGYSIEECYKLSQRIIKDKMRPEFMQGYNIGYADIFSMIPGKQSLKQWELDLDIAHIEADVNWDVEATPEETERLITYCKNDVLATEKVWDANKKWVTTRQILASITGGSMMDSTNSLTQKLVFGDVKNPQVEFNIPDLSKEFPGYEFSQQWVTTKTGKNVLETTSTYKGFDTGTGGFNYNNNGIYINVKAFDVTSMHPSSIIAMNMFGDKYTAKFKELMNLRVMCKHKELEEAKKAFDGMFADIITDVDVLYDLSESLKLAINSVYGMTFSAFETKFRDQRNVDNIVAKRGALFMINLKEEVEKLGYTVVHIKTDCIKVANADKFIEDFINDYGSKYGYGFEIEDIFETFALINAASYIGKLDNGKWVGRTATIKHPYVWSMLTEGKYPETESIRETKAVTGDTKIYAVKDGERYFIGKCGSFVPVVNNGYELIRDNNGTTGAVVGTKNHQWMEWSMYKTLPNPPEIDWSYYDDLYQTVINELNKVGDISLLGLA